MSEFSGFSFLKLISPTQIPGKPSQKKISPKDTPRFSFLNSFKKVAQQKPIDAHKIGRISLRKELQTTKNKPMLEPINATETPSKLITDPKVTSEAPKSEPVIRPVYIPETSREFVTNPIIKSETPESRFVMTPISEPQIYEPQINELQTSQLLQISERDPVITPINGDGNYNDNISETTSSDRVIRPGNTSETSQAEQTDGPKIYPRNIIIEDVPITYPQITNGCGLAALETVMSYYGENIVNLVDPPLDIGLDPLYLKEMTGDKMDVCMVNNWSIENLVSCLRAGIPVIMLGINGGPRGDEVFTLEDIPYNFSRGHWNVLVGREFDENGNPIYIMHDSNSPVPLRWTEEELFTNCDHNIIPGGHRFCMAMAPKNSYKAAQLENILGGDRISNSFRNTLDIVHTMYEAYYEARGPLIDIFTDMSDIAARFQNIVEDILGTTANAFEDAWDATTDAIEDAVNWLFG